LARYSFEVIMSLYKKNLRVLVIEPALQRPIYDKARPNVGKDFTNA